MTSETEKKIDRYTPAAIEQKWRERWASSGLHNTPDTSDKPNFYFLTMFPYPSGEIHVGHWYAFAPPDAAARFLRMRGHNVLFPMGFDAFGINAENAAIDRGIHPAVWTEKNMAHMRDQFNRMGAAIDWRREVVTCYPEYYRWNQWMFLKLFEKGLAYRADAPVNWCPRDETVLANEQVINGRCERCDTVVVKQQMTQWFYRITRYADELLKFEGLDWPERVRVLQTNWIGRSEGAELAFPVDGVAGEEIRFFTTRPDTIYGATFMVLAPEHPLVAKITAPARRSEVERYVASARNMAEIERTSTAREKTGVDTGAFARNVFTGERIPVWVADYVLATYGTGAIMAVPAHDERDFAFARKYGLDIREVIKPEGAAHDHLDAPYAGEGIMVRSGPFSDMRSEQGKKAIADEAKKRGIGGPSVTYRLRDWLISRQRYWGTPIPIVHCERCGAVPVPYEQLPVVLPRDGLEVRRRFHEQGARKEMAAGAAVHRRRRARDPAPSVHALHDEGAARSRRDPLRRARAALPLPGHDRLQGPQDVQVAWECGDARRVRREVRRRHSASLHDVHGSVGRWRGLGCLRHRGRAPLPATRLGDGSGGSPASWPA